MCDSGVHIFESARDVSIDGGGFYSAGSMSIGKNFRLLPPS